MALYKICLLLLFYIYFLAHQHKAAGRKTRLDIQNYGCNGNLLCDHSVMERNCIFSLQSHGKALEKECCLPDVFCDSGDTPANLLCELNGHLMPCTSCLYGKWAEDECAGQFGVFVYLVLCCLLGCCTWFSCCAANVRLRLRVWGRCKARRSYSCSRDFYSQDARCSVVV